MEILESGNRDGVKNNALLAFEAVVFIELSWLRHEQTVGSSITL